MSSPLASREGGEDVPTMCSEEQWNSPKALLTHGAGYLSALWSPPCCSSRSIPSQLLLAWQHPEATGASASQGDIGSQQVSVQ